MAHSLFLGMTESGKTTLARALAARYKRAGWGVLVLDPLRDPRWQADYITDDSSEFLEVFWNSRRCMVFMDEGGESVGRYDKAMQQTATRGRHWGHSCHFIAQRATQLSPLVRDQCSHLFLFCSSWKDGQLLSEEFNEPKLAECNTLKQGEYMHATRFKRVQIHGAKSNESASDGRRNSGDGNRRNAADAEEEQQRERSADDASASRVGPAEGGDDADADGGNDA